MVRLTKIYPRGGDQGETGLGDGRRVAKSDPRVEAYGDIDEVNAAIGLARLQTSGEADAMLARIQNDLFDLGADLCKPARDGETPPPLRLGATHVERLEREIDAMNARLAALESFVLPGGTPAAAHLHLARTICRRAERRIVTLSALAAVNEQALRYVNRLSDHLFVLARLLNDEGRRDVLWRPGANL
ncbi:MAG: cob(I)yrinic acid a,c-diamide adenosyltransferase [Rhodospirillales bacterium]|nr:cob(I)yrinic acid a,c-diamide adenosyltransferase [Rhodospirillales bacterium]